MFASVGAGLVPALCSRLLFWGGHAGTAPTALYSFGTHKGCPYGICTLFSVLCTLLGGHAGTAPTALFSFGHPQGMPLRRCSLFSVICYLTKSPYFITKSGYFIQKHPLNFS